MKTLKEKISKILNDHIDFAEWSTDDTETTNALFSLFTKEKEKWIKKQCTQTHDYGYGNGYVPHNEKGEIASGLKCIHCNYPLKTKK